MATFDWDFSKLPESEHQRVIELIQANEWRELIDIHNHYQLSSVTYCCDESGIKAWFFYGLQTGKIKNETGSTAGG